MRCVDWKQSVCQARKRSYGQCDIYRGARAFFCEDFMKIFYFYFDDQARRQRAPISRRKGDQYRAVYGRCLLFGSGLFGDQTQQRYQALQSWPPINDGLPSLRRAASISGANRETEV